MREKVSLELKVEALGLLKTGLSISSVSKQLKIPSGVLQTWSQIYAKEGVKGLAAYPKNRGQYKYGVFMAYSWGIHGVFICIGYVSVMYRLCIGTYSEVGGGIRQLY